MQTPPAFHALPQSPLHALSSLPSNRRMAVLAFVALAGFLAAATFFALYYPGGFHSDSAAHYVLARAMVEERSLLPHDFAYGNQLILWRNNLFIAPVLAAGFEGYRAYALGSAINFALFFVIAFMCIETVAADWRRSLLATSLLFLPLGHSEGDFILGQQSHLAMVVLALVIAVQAFRAGEGARRPVVLCCIAVFLLVVEAPARAAMVLLPLGVAVWASGRAKGSARLGVAILATTMAGFAANRWLLSTHQVAGIPELPLAMYAHLADRANQLTRGLVDLFIGFYQFDGLLSKGGHVILYGMKSLALAAFVVASGWLAVRLVRRTVLVEERRSPAGAIEFLGMTAVAGAALGFWAVCAIEYWLDIRHFLWALMLLKLVIVLAVLNALPRQGRAAPAAVVAACMAAILMSTAATAMWAPGYRQRQRAEFARHVPLPLVAPLRTRMKEMGIHRIYGDHWSTLRVEALVPGAEASVLEAEGGEIRFVSFLTRPSRKCAKGQVFYLLDRGVGPNLAVIDTVLAAGGRVLESYSANQSLYVGPPVWNMTGCG